MIDPRALRTLLAICRAGTISGAARQLNISQPSVSVAIAQLERAVNATLFTRSRTGITLTPEGEALRHRAEAIDNLLSDAEAEVALIREGVRGPLRVGGTPGALVSLLPGALSEFGERLGRFSLHVLERPDRDLIGMLRRAEIELAFVTTGLDERPADITELSIAKDPFALIVGRRHDHLPSEISLAEAASLDWVFPEATGGFRRQIDALFAASGVAMPRHAVFCDSLLTTKAIVRGSGRITILPRGVAAADLSVGVLRAITLREANFERRIGLLHWNGAKLSPIAADLLEALSR